jgi:toxin ParE1/3/4
MRLAWSASALNDRIEIFEHVSIDDPGAAIHIDQRIDDLIRGLLRFPEIGRPGRVPGTRELVIMGTGLIAAYRIDGDTIRVLRLLHGARKWPDDFSTAK